MTLSWAHSLVPSPPFSSLVVVMTPKGRGRDESGAAATASEGTKKRNCVFRALRRKTLTPSRLAHLVTQKH